LLSFNDIKRKRSLYEIFKKFLWITCVAFAGAIFTEAVGLNIWPNILVNYDKAIGKKPDPSISIVVWEQIKNEKFMNYNNRCDEFVQFLISSGLAHKLPSDQFFAQTSEEVGNPPSCVVSALFPNFIHGREEYFCKFPASSEWLVVDDCKDCKQLRISIGNDGRKTVDYIRARIRLNENWEVRSVEGDIVEKRDTNTLVFYRENIVAKDVIEAIIWIRNKTGKRIAPAEFIDKLLVTYGWRGMEMSLDNGRINATYGIVIENCKTNCKSNKIGNVTLEKWDGFPKVH
jgi:hypothetical protein